MKCPKCNTENNDNARYCRKCGNLLTKTDVYIEEYPNRDTRPEERQTSNVRISGYGLIIGIIISVALLVGVFALIGGKPVINLNQYVTVEIQGYDGYGTATVYVDWDKIQEKYGDKIFGRNSSNNDEDSMSKHTLFAEFNDYIVPSLEKQSELSNGDKIKCSWSISSNTPQENLNCKLVYKDREIVVEGLKPTKKIDLFANVQKPFFIFEGSDGNTQASIDFGLDLGAELYRDERIVIVYNRSDYFGLHTASVIENNCEICEIIFSLNAGIDLSNGDEIQFYMRNFEPLCEIGYEPQRTAFIYTVENRPEVIASKEEIDTDKVIKFIQSQLPEDSEYSKYRDFKVNSIYFVSAKDTTITDRRYYIFADYSYVSDDYFWILLSTNHNRYCEISSFYYEDGLFKCDEIFDCSYSGVYNLNNASDYIEKNSEKYDFTKLY